VFALVEPALLTLGVDLSFIKTNWQEKLLDKYIRLSEEETGKIREPLQHMIGEAMNGSFAMTEEQVNKILSYAPGKKELKRHLHKYFEGVRRFRAVSTTVSSAKPVDIDQTMDDLDACEKGVAAFGQELADVGALTDKVSVTHIAAHLDAMMLKLTTLRQSNNTANQKVLKALNDQACKLLAKVDVKSEKRFKVDMNKFGTPIATKQAEMKGVLNIVKTENPGLFATSGEKSTAVGQRRESIVAVAVKTESAMTEYTCVYVIMTMANNPKLHLTSAVGTALRTSMASALATLSKGRQKNIFKAEIDAIQATLSDTVKAISS